MLNENSSSFFFLNFNHNLINYKFHYPSTKYKSLLLVFDVETDDRRLKISHYKN